MSSQIDVTKPISNNGEHSPYIVNVVSSRQSDIINCHPKDEKRQITLAFLVHAINIEFINVWSYGQPL